MYARSSIGLGALVVALLAAALIGGSETAPASSTAHHHAVMPLISQWPDRPLPRPRHATRHHPITAQRRDRPSQG